MIFKPNKELKDFIKFMLTHIDTELKSINQKLDKTTALDTVIKNEYIISDTPGKEMRYTYKVHACPTCGETIPTPKCHFCFNCGQALKPFEEVGFNWKEGEL